MLELVPTSAFKRSLKRLKKQGKDLSKLHDVLSDLQQEKRLSPARRDHPLVGKFRGMRECHVEPDWLLIYRVDRGRMILIAVDTGTHDHLRLE